MKPTVIFSALLVICLFITCCKEDSEPTIPTTVMGIPCPGMPTVEYRGKTYNTVQIGNQCWLRENLDVGTMIDSLRNQTDNDTIEKYCYRNDTSNCNTYGGLYQWNEAMQYTNVEGAQGICPTGWHIPTLAEFRTCSTTVGGDGNALKAIGQGIIYAGGDGRGTNTSGFSALLAGYRYNNGHFSDLFNFTLFWSSTEYDFTPADIMVLNKTNGVIYLDNYNYQGEGYSVRCLKD